MVMIDNPQTINNKKHMIDTNTGILKALRIRTINIIVLKYMIIPIKLSFKYSLYFIRFYNLFLFLFQLYFHNPNQII